MGIAANIRIAKRKKEINVIIKHIVWKNNKKTKGILVFREKCVSIKS